MKGGKLFVAAALVMMLAAAALVIAPVDADDEPLAIEDVKYQSISAGNFFVVTFNQEPVDATAYVYIDDGLVKVQDVNKAKTAIKIPGSYDAETQTYQVYVESATGSDAYPKYNVAIDEPIVGGTVTTDVVKAAEGYTVTVTAEASYGYDFDYVTVNGIEIEGMTFEMPAHDVIVGAVFNAKTFTVTVSDEIVNGTVEANKTEAFVGEIVSLTVTPADGYVLDYITVNGTEIEGTSFAMPAADALVFAAFKEKPEPQIVSISALAAQTDYYVGDSFNAKDMVVTAYYDDLSSRDLAADEYTYSPEGPLAVTDTEVTVTLIADPSIYDTVAITVTEKPEPTIVSISAVAGKTAYYVDESFDASTMTVTATLSDETTKVLDDADYDYEPKGALALTDTKVTVTLVADPTITCDVPITVTEKPEPKIVSIDAVAEKTEYTAGQIINKSTLTVTATLSDETTKVLAESEFDYEPKRALVTTDTEILVWLFADDTIRDTVAITVTEEPAVYFISVAIGIPNGKVTTDPAYSAVVGTTVTVIATPDEGYQVAALYVDGVALLPGDNTFTMPARNVEVSATFILIPTGNTVTYVYPDETEVKEYAVGEEVLYNVKHIEGFEFGGAEFVPETYHITGDYTIEFTMPDYPIVVTIKYLPKEFAIVTIDPEHGTVGTGPSYSAAEGTTVYCYATPEEGYELVRFIVMAGEEEVTIHGGEYFYMPAHDVTVTAEYKEKAPEYAITVLESEHGTAIASKDKAAAGETIALSVVDVEPFYILDKFVVMAGEEPVEVVDNEFTMPASAVTVKAEFKKIPHVTFDITVIDPEHGTVTVSKTKALVGDTIDLTATPDEGYEFEQYIVKAGEELIPVSDNKFTMPESDVTVTAVFHEKITPKVVSIAATAEKTDYYVGETFDATGLVVIATLDNGELVHLEAGDYSYAPTGPLALTDTEITVTYAADDEITCTVAITVIEKPVVPYTITYYVKGVVACTEVYLAGDAVVPYKYNPQPGETFDGWFADPEFTTTAVIPETMPAEDLDFYGKVTDNGLRIVFHDLRDGKPIDIWWFGFNEYSNIMLPNGADDYNNKFLYWLAEDMETKLSWNAAYSLLDIDQNDCLIWLGGDDRIPGSDRIYELNAVYAIEVTWVGFDGEVLKVDQVDRGELLTPPYNDTEMQALLDDYLPEDEKSVYVWNGWSIEGSEETYSSAAISTIAADGKWTITATYKEEVKEYDITFISHDGTETLKVPYGDTPVPTTPEGYDDDEYFYAFYGWDPEIVPVDGDATYNAVYVKTSKVKTVTIKVDDADRGHFLKDDEEAKYTEFLLTVPVGYEYADIGYDTVTFEFDLYLFDYSAHYVYVFTAVANPDDVEHNRHFEFDEWVMSEDGLTYMAKFTEDIITSKDLDRIQTYFDDTRAEDGDFVFTMKSKDKLAIPKGELTVSYYEYVYDEDFGDWIQLEASCDAMEMDWGTDYGANIISLTISYADLEQDGQPLDITEKNIGKMWLTFTGYNGAYCESNKATPGGQ